MTICYDPTEARAYTLLPQDLIAKSQKLGNFEHCTGADLLVTPHKVSLKTITSISPHVAALTKFAADGLLIQRKSGSDLLHSIPNLKEIQARMSIWCGNPVLLYTGVSFIDDQVVVNGTPNGRWTVRQVRGALYAWQLRGGSVIPLESDKEITEAITHLDNKVLDFYLSPSQVIAHKTAAQSVNTIDANWLNTKRAWPKGISERMLLALALYLATELDIEPSLINALELARSEGVLKVPGWGVKSQRKVLDWVGVESTRQALKLKLNLGGMGEGQDKVPDLVKLQSMGYTVSLDKEVKP